MHAQWVAIYLSVFFSWISAARIRFTSWVYLAIKIHSMVSTQWISFTVWIVFHPVVGKTGFMDRSFFGAFDFCWHLVTRFWSSLFGWWFRLFLSDPFLSPWKAVNLHLMLSVTGRALKLLAAVFAKQSVTEMNALENPTSEIFTSADLPINSR